MTLGFVFAAVAAPTAAPETTTSTPSTVDLTAKAKIVLKSVSYKDSLGNDRCTIDALVQFPEVKNATSYSIVVTGRAPSHDVSRTGPPFTQDHFVDGPLVVDVPAGSHWWAISGASGPTCDGMEAYVNSHFTIAKVTAEVPATEGWIKGRITDEDGVPFVERVTVTARGKRTLTATTGPDGRYAIKVAGSAAGAYHVTPKHSDLKFKPASRTVTAAKGRTAIANFQGSGACRAHASQATVNPQDGLYVGSATAPEQLVLNYGCRTREVIVRLSPQVGKTYGCKALDHGRTVYTKPLEVDARGRFQWTIGTLWDFHGVFLDSTAARVTVTSRDCGGLAIRQTASYVSSAPFQF